MENTFSITPTNQMINLKPGDKYTGSITVINSSNSGEDFHYFVSVLPYSVVGEKYEADLSTMYDRTMIKDWIEIDSPTGTLEPGKSEEVNFTITVPTSAPAGGQYASIVVTDNNNDSSVVSSTLGIASVLYANVAGDTVYDGKIIENNIPGFVMSTPVKVDSLISNDGNVHMLATTQVTIKNTLTGENILPSQQSDGYFNEIIMPGTTHRIERDLTDLPIVGVVEVSQTIYYNGESSVVNKNVIICPVWFMVLVVVLLSGIVGGIIVAIKKHRRKKTNI